MCDDFGAYLRAFAARDLPLFETVTELRIQSIYLSPDKASLEAFFKRFKNVQYLKGCGQETFDALKAFKGKAIPRLQWTMDSESGSENRKSLFDYLKSE